MNVQIKGLNYEKPQLGGSSFGPGYRKIGECAKVNRFFYFFILQRKSRKCDKYKKSRASKSEKCEKCVKYYPDQTNRRGGVRGERQPDLPKHISNFINVKNTVGKLWIVMVVVVVPYIRNLLDKLRTKPIVLIKSLKMCFNNYYTISISASESLYKKCEKCHPQILTNPVNIIFMLFNVSMSCKLCSGNKTLLTDRLFFYSNPNTYNPIINGDILMTSVTIALLLICAGVELNPGPRQNVEIITYNCNGLGDKIKLRRLLAKVNKKVQNGAIIFLQETHIVNTEHLKSIWSNKFL